MIFQAGDSEEGRDLGASIADAIFTHAQSLEQARSFRTELRERAAAKGRDPQHLLIVPGISLIIRDTDEEAREREEGGSSAAGASTARWGSGPAVRMARLPPIRPGRTVPGSARARRPAQLPHPGQRDQQTGEGQRFHAASARRAPARRPPLAVRRFAAHGRRRDPALVRGRRRSTASTSASRCPASSPGSPRRCCRSCVSGASPAPSTTPRRCAATSACQSRSIATRPLARPPSRCLAAEQAPADEPALVA